MTGSIRPDRPADHRRGNERGQQGEGNRKKAAAKRRTYDRTGRKDGGCRHASDSCTESRNVRPSAETEPMNLEESIAVAIGIAVAISFLAFFLFAGFGISLT